MFNWLKRRAQLAIIKSAEQDIDRIIASLRGASNDELALIVAIATHWRNTFYEDGIDLLRPAEAERTNPGISMLLSRSIKGVQKDNPSVAVGLIVWLHTVRAANMPELRYKGRIMWGELSKGFDGALEAGETLVEASGMQLKLSSPGLIPEGLEPDHR